MGESHRDQKRVSESHTELELQMVVNPTYLGARV